MSVAFTHGTDIERPLPKGESPELGVYEPLYLARPAGFQIWSRIEALLKHDAFCVRSLKRFLDPTAGFQPEPVLTPNSALTFFVNLATAIS